MYDPVSLVALSGSGLVAVSLAAAAGLRGWTGWLELRRLGLDSALEPVARPAAAAARIELLDLRDRVKRLEAIANGG